MAACGLLVTSLATCSSYGSPVTSTSTCGFVALAMTDVSSTRSACTTTLQGSSSPIWRSTLIARCASAGLQAPRMRWSSMFFELCLQSGLRVHLGRDTESVFCEAFSGLCDGAGK